MRFILILLTLLSPLTAAEPFAGQWKLQVDKSNVPGTYKFLAVGEGKFQTDNGVGLGPVLPIDGSAHESPSGRHGFAPAH